MTVVVEIYIVTKIDVTLYDITDILVLVVPQQPLQLVLLESLKFNQLVMVIVIHVLQCVLKLEFVVQLLFDQLVILIL